MCRGVRHRPWRERKPGLEESTDEAFEWRVRNELAATGWAKLGVLARPVPTPAAGFLDPAVGRTWWEGAPVAETVFG